MRNLLLLALLFAFVAPTTGSASETPPRPGHALLTYVAANRGICLVGADGKHPVRLTPRWRGLGTPAWSPRGRYIALKRSVGFGRTKIVVADARAHVLWRFGTWGENGSPLWSPDGRHIAYRGADANDHNGFDVARPDGSYDHRLLECDSTDCHAHPSWSFDGQRLAFEDQVDPPGPVGIFSSRADGSDRRLLVSNAQQPAYSPAEATLAYTAPGPESTWSLFVADADGENPRRLTPPVGRDAWPTWSPDGRFLAFLMVPLSGDDVEIAVVPSDGSAEPVVIASYVPLAFWRTTPFVWSPSGKLIAFMRGSSLVVVSAEGGTERTVVSRVGNVGYTSDGLSLEAWRPAVALPAAKRPACPR